MEAIAGTYYQVIGSSFYYISPGGSTKLYLCETGLLFM